MEKHIQDADPSMFGGAAPALPTAPRCRRRRSPTRKPAAQHFVDAALAQRGDKYEFGAEAELDDANPTALDRSELTQWAAHQAGIEIPDGSAAQYLDLKAKGLLIPVDQAAHTPGALLFTFSSEPTAGGERPDYLPGRDQPGQRQHGRGRRRQGVTTMESAAGSSTPRSCPDCRASRHRPPHPRAARDRRPDRHRVMPGYQIDPGVDISNPERTADNDGLTNHFESVIHSNPTLADSDLDGLIDGFEASLGTDPMKMDTDLDGFTDGMEVHFGDESVGRGRRGRPCRRRCRDGPWGSTLPVEPDPQTCPTTTMRSARRRRWTSTRAAAWAAP